MPLYDCGSVGIVEGFSLTGVSLSNPRQDGSTFKVDWTVAGTFYNGKELELFATISDRDNAAGRGSTVTTETVSGDSGNGTIAVEIEERPTAATGWSSDTLPAEFTLEVSGGGETVAETTDIEFAPENLERLEITNAEQDGSKVVVDFEVGGGSGFNIGEDEAGNIGEVQVKNPVPWGDGTESWIPGLVESGVAQLLPNPTSLNLGAIDGGVTLQGNTTTATIEIPLGLTPPEPFGPVESFVGVGVTTENGTQLIDTFDITIDPVAWIDDVDVDCELNEAQIGTGETATVDVTVTNNAGPAAFGSTVEFDLFVGLRVDGELVDETQIQDFRGPRGVGSDRGGGVVTFDPPLETTPEQPGSYNLEVLYTYVEGSGSRIIPTDENL